MTASTIIKIISPSSVPAMSTLITSAVYRGYQQKANKTHNIDVDLVAEIITEYDEIMSEALDKKIVIAEN